MRGTGEQAFRRLAWSALIFALPAPNLYPGTKLMRSPFLSRKILVIGDLILDEYVDTIVTRVSPEAPVPVAKVKKRWATLGGAANVALNASSLGCDVWLCGVLGKDSSSAALQKLAREAGIHFEPVYCPGRPTINKLRIISQGQHIVRIDTEENDDLPARVLKEVWLKAEAAIPGMDAVIISDYNKGIFRQSAAWNGSLASKVIVKCKNLGIPVLVDPKGRDWQRYANADCVTPNLKELAEICGVKAVPEDRQADLGRQVMQALNLPHLLLTRSEKGLTLFNGAELENFPAKAREVRDVSGAGDTVIAVLGACVAAGLGWQEGARLANLAGGMVVEKLGTQTVTFAELSPCLAEAPGDRNLPLLQRKMYSREAIANQTEKWRNEGKRIVFTNGCFDLLHPGHLRLIEEAAAQGDKLIVGLNSDASVKRLKGPDRPLQLEADRALVLAALERVDAVVIFGEDTPAELIEAIAPDVLVKGGDYRKDQVVGSDFVSSRGGRVHIVDFREGCSTTGIVNRIKSPAKAKVPARREDAPQNAQAGPG